MDIVNESQLIDVMNTAIKDMLENVSKKIADKLMEIVNDQWYSHSTGGSQWYVRTYEFFNAITTLDVIRIGGVWNTKILIDPSKIDANESDSYFNQHMSLDGSTDYNGKSIGEWLIQWIEEGQNSRVHSYEGIHMFEQLDDYTRANLNSFIKSTLKGYGFEIK